MTWPPPEDRCAAAVGDGSLAVGLADPVRQIGRWTTTCFSHTAIRLADAGDPQCAHESRYGNGLCEEHEHQGCVRLVRGQRTCFGCGSRDIAIMTDTIACHCPCGFEKVTWRACSGCAERWRKP